MPAKTRDLASEIAFLTRSLKAPTLREAVTRLAERARSESWTYEEFLAARLQGKATKRPMKDRADDVSRGGRKARDGAEGAEVIQKQLAA